MSALTLTRLPMPPMTRTCRRQPCSRPAPSAQPVDAPAPRPRSGIAGLPAHCLWPELTVATGSSRSSFVHTAPGYLCPCRHSQAVKPLWFGRTFTHVLPVHLSSSPCRGRLAGLDPRVDRAASVMMLNSPPGLRRKGA